MDNKLEVEKLFCKLEGEAKISSIDIRKAVYLRLKGKETYLPVTGRHLVIREQDCHTPASTQSAEANDTVTVVSEELMHPRLVQTCSR